MYFNKYKIKRRVSRKEIIYRKINLACCFTLIISLMVFAFMNKAYAELTPNKNVQISSQHSEYVSENNPIGWTYNVGRDNTGGWQVDKKAKWTGYGEAELTLSISAVPRYSKKKQDIILVINNTDSKVMPSGNFSKLKDRLKEFSSDHIANEKGKIALVEFNSSATILSGFTDNNLMLDYEITRMAVTNDKDVSYYKPLLKVDELLRNYTLGSDREVVVIFVSGVPPTFDNSLEVGEYEYLTDQYPYLTVNAINYSAYAFHAHALAFAPVATKSLKKISRELIQASLYKDPDAPNSEYVMADMNHENPILVAARSRLSFSQFDVSEYINNDYFEVESTEEITNSRGSVSLQKENNTQKIFWTMKDENFVSGTPFRANKLVVKLKLKDELLDKGGIYPTSSKSIIKTSMQDTPSENVNTTTTTILPDNFKVKYEGNSPSGCTARGVPDAENHSVFATVKISEERPTCEGYQFNGWKLVSDNVEYINDDTFLMPEEDVIIRAQWSDLKIKKTMDGNVYTAQTLYDVMRSKAIPDNINSEFVQNEYINSFSSNQPTSGILYSHSSDSISSYSPNNNGRGVYLYSPTANDDKPLVFYRGKVEDNNVLFANICWKATNSTPTGGVKLIFSGYYTGNACVTVASPTTYGPAPYSYVGSDSKFGTSGYMYGKLYDYTSEETYYLPTLISIVGKYNKKVNLTTFNNDTSFYKTNGKRIYGRGIRYNATAVSDSDGYHQAGTYTLLDTFTMDDNVTSISSENGGIYTCEAGLKNGGIDCNYADYILSYEGTTMTRVYLTSDGKLLDDLATDVYIGDGYTKNSDGTYTLTNPVKYNLLSLYDKVLDFDSNNSIKGKYYCTDKSTTCNATNGPIKIVTMSNKVGDGPSLQKGLFEGVPLARLEYVYGKNVEFVNGKYKLTNKITLSESKMNNVDLNASTTEYIYTCGDLTDECDEVTYRPLQILLTDGDKKEDIMNKVRQDNNSSIAKNQMDSFYSSSILSRNLDEYIEDTVYCNDRSEFFYRTKKFRSLPDNSEALPNVKPSITCPAEDSFTVSDSIGNGKLTYPVGMMTYDEMVLAGANGFIRDTSYLSINYNWWTMTPHGGSQVIYNNGANGNDYSYVYDQSVRYTSGIAYRPVISIKPTVSINGGDGTASNPYTFKLD